MERIVPNRPVESKMTPELEKRSKKEKELDEILKRANKLADKVIDEMSKRKAPHHK